MKYAYLPSEDHVHYNTQPPIFTNQKKKAKERRKKTDPKRTIRGIHRTLYLCYFYFLFLHLRFVCGIEWNDNGEIEHKHGKQSCVCVCVVGIYAHMMPPVRNWIFVFANVTRAREMSRDACHSMSNRNAKRIDQSCLIFCRCDEVCPRCSQFIVCLLFFRSLDFIIFFFHFTVENSENDSENWKYATESQRSVCMYLYVCQIER